MASCCVCGKDVSCGLVLCGENCKDKLKAVPDDVEYKLLNIIAYLKNPLPFASNIMHIQLENRSEKSVINELRISLPHLEVESVYFIQTQKLINLYE